MTTYVQSLINEIRLTSQMVIKKDEEIQISSVFFGGGTPSILDEKHIENIMNSIKDSFVLADNAEVTIECNPGTVNMKKLETYIKSGINRISFGLQSCDDEELKLLGRIHTFEEFKQGFNMARTVGFSNINVDLMSAIPGQSVEGFKNSLKKVVELNPEHISAYSLILEEGTYLYENIDKYPAVPSEDDERQMYYDTREILKVNGYAQYEISNYAKSGFECRHNLLYWDRDDYLGFGIGAASLWNEERYSNIRDINAYIESQGDPKVVCENIEKLTREDAMQEFMFLGLRKVEGVDTFEFEQVFGVPMEEIYQSEIDRNIERGLLKQTGSRLSLTSRGMDLSNTVMSDFII